MWSRGSRSWNKLSTTRGNLTHWGGRGLITSHQICVPSCEQVYTGICRSVDKAMISMCVPQVLGRLIVLIWSDIVAQLTGSKNLDNSSLFKLISQTTLLQTFKWCSSVWIYLVQHQSKETVGFTICTFLPLFLKKSYTDAFVLLDPDYQVCICVYLWTTATRPFLVVTVVSEELNIWHRFKTQHFFFFPVPPNLGLSSQKTQLPLSGRRQAGHFPHFFLLTPVFM